MVSVIATKTYREGLHEDLEPKTYLSCRPIQNLPIPHTASEEEEESMAERKKENRKRKIILRRREARDTQYAEIAGRQSLRSRKTGTLFSNSPPTRTRDKLGGRKNACV